MGSDVISASDVYNAINGLRGEVREDQAKIWEEIKESKTTENEIKLKAEKQNGRVYGLEKGQKEIKDQNSEITKEVVETKKLFTEHIGDKKVHHNDAIANETIQQRIRRKAPVYTVVGGGTAGGLYLLVEIIKWALNNLG